MSKELSATRMTNYTPSHRETSSIGKRKLLTPDEVLRLSRDEALVIFRGQKVLKVKKFDYTKHPESKKMRDCNVRNYIPSWHELRKSGSSISADMDLISRNEPSKGEILINLEGGSEERSMENSIVKPLSQPKPKPTQATKFNKNKTHAGIMPAKTKIASKKGPSNKKAKTATPKKILTSYRWMK